MTERDEQMRAEDPASELGEGEPQQPDETADTETPSTAEELDAMRRERDELNNRLLRTMADYQNFARRAEQNVVTAREQQSMEMAKALVTVLDHFDHALTIDADKATAKDVLSGVVMVRDELLRALARFGVERVDVQPGEPFDPNRHDALMREKAEGVETNHITQQLQPGYILRDKTIRPVKVGVAE